MPGLATSDRRQRLLLGHHPAERAVFVQVAEHLDADGLVQAAHGNRFVATGAEVSDRHQILVIHRPAAETLTRSPD